MSGEGPLFQHQVLNDMDEAIRGAVRILVADGFEAAAITRNLSHHLWHRLTEIVNEEAPR